MSIFDVDGDMAIENNDIITTDELAEDVWQAVSIFYATILLESSSEERAELLTDLGNLANKIHKIIGVKLVMGDGDAVALLLGLAGRNEQWPEIINNENT